MGNKKYFSKSEVESMILNFEVNRFVNKKNPLREEIISECKCLEDGLIYRLTWERISVIDNTPEFYGQLAYSK